MALSLSGQFNDILDAFGDMIAEAEAFQTWCGVAPADVGTATGKAEAGEHVHLLEYTEPSEDQAAARPIVVVNYGEAFRASRVASGSQFARGGTVRVGFWNVADPDDNDYSDQNILLEFMNNMGAICTELETMAGEGHPHIVAHEKVSGPSRLREEDRATGEVDDIYYEHQFTWGFGNV